jgi:hypothetical protein
MGKKSRCQCYHPHTRIGELVKRAGVSVQAIRFYEGDRHEEQETAGAK